MLRLAAAAATVVAASVMPIANAAPAVPSTNAQEAPVVTKGVAVDNGIYSTVREGASGLRGYTVYRPADMSLFKKRSLPVVAWGNGGCLNQNITLASFLGGISARGYIIIADGPVSGGILPEEPREDGGSEKTLLKAIDWALGPKAAKQFANRVNPKKVATAGWSCGGLQALVAGQDKRVKSIAALATGFFPECSRYCPEEAEKITAPTLVFNGGPEDIAYENSITTYEDIPAPAVLASYRVVGHSGLFFGWNIETGWDDPAIMNAGINMVADWFDFTLRRDGEAGNQFVGDDCGLCTTPDWTIESKGFN